MRIPPRASLIATCLALSALGLFVALRFSVTTDITAFMPTAGDQTQLRLSRQLADSELTRTMVLTLGAPDAGVAAEASRAFEAALRADARVASRAAAIEGGPAAGSEQAIYELYHPRRLGFLADNPHEVRAELTPERLREAAARLKQRLAQPMSPLLARLAPSDPLLILTDLFERLERAQDHALRLHDGRFVTPDGRFAVLFLTTHARAFDSQAHAPLMAGVADAFTAVNRRFGGELSLDQSGVQRFAIQAEQAIRGDIQRVSTLSIVSMTVLLVSLFRSLRLVALAAVPLLAGVLAGVATSLALYGRVHGVTLAFGASLLGVAIDYVVHLYCHHAVSGDSGVHTGGHASSPPHGQSRRGPSPPRGSLRSRRPIRKLPELLQLGDPRATLRSIGPSLVMGAVTTVAGFLALAFAGFEGLTEVALFSSVGIAAALLTTFTVLPSMLPREVRAVPLRARSVAALAHLYAVMRRRRAQLWLLPALALAAFALGAPQIELSEDFMDQSRLDPALLAEDQRVRARVARFDQRRFVIALGDSDEAALQVNDQVDRALAAAVAQGELEGYRSVGALLPSAAKQRAVAQAVRAALGSGAALASALAAEGFRAEAFAPFWQTLREPTAEPLRFDALAASPLSGLVRPFRVRLDDQVAFVSFVRGVQQPSALGDRLAQIPGAVLLDQATQVRETHQRYQRRVLWLLGVGLGVVLLLLALRYRDLRRTAAAFVPSLLAAAVTVAVLALSGHGLSLVSLTALLMVVSMGVDYGVFLVDAERAAHPEAALLSVSVAAATTLFGFGLLALSEHPMLAAIGLTAWVGVLACLLLAPATLVLAGTSSEPPGAAS